MKNLNEDLQSGNFKQTYLFYGEESYLKKLFKDRFVKAMLPEGDSMNLTYFEGKSIDTNAIIEYAETLPFMAERRLIIIENSGFFKSGENPLVLYLKSIPDTTHIIFIEKDVDKRSKMYKALKSEGVATEMSHQSEDTLRSWVFSIIKDEYVSMDTPTVDYFIHRVGLDMENISNELEKLISYVKGKGHIDKSDIDEVCVVQISNQIFDMINAVATRNQREALRLYYDLLSLKEPPMRILYLMTRQYRLMFHIKDLSDRGFDRREIAARAGVPPFVAGKYISQANNFSVERLRLIIEDSANLEEGVKIGKIQDNIAVEMFIVKNSS